MNEGRIRTDPRISRRRRTVERARRRTFVVRLLAAVAAAAMVWGLFFSPLLDVREVRVVGTEHTRTAEVVEAVDLGPGDNLLLLSTDEVAARTLRLPWVRDVDVDRKLPGTVRIRIKERTPALVLALGAAKWTIDRQGHVVAVGEAKKGLPVLAGVNVGTVEPGVRLQTPEAVEALAAWRGLPPRIRAQVSGVFAPTLERISFSLSDGTVVRYGAAERMPAKNTVLRSLLARVRAEGLVAAYIDVRVPTAPAVSAGAPDDSAAAASSTAPE